MTKFPCFFCGNESFVEGKGVPYYRAQKPDGKWASVPICIPCLEEKQPRFRGQNA